MARRAVLSMGGAILLGGCALNALRVETTQSFVQSSNATVATTGAYLDEVARRRRAANAALLAAQPSCRPYGTDVLGRYAIRVRDFQAVAARRKRAGAAPFCMTKGERITGDNSFELVLNPIGPDVLKPRLVLLAATADYAAALAKVVDKGSPKLDEELGGIAGKLDDVGVIAGVAGVPVPSAATALASAEGKALIAALQMVADIAHERGQVAEIRRIAARNGSVVEAGLERIKSDVADFAELDHISALRLVDANFVAYQQSRGWDFEHRRAVALVLAGAEGDYAASAASAQKVAAAVDVLIAAHRDLLAVLADDPTLTAKQKRRVAEITRQRIWRALDLISGAVGALAGV